MKIISRKSHSRLDYIAGILLIFVPIFSPNSLGGAALWTPISLGLVTIVVSLLTKYEGGIIGIIPFRLHLALDILQAIALASAPWIFGFTNATFMPYIFTAIIEVLIVATTSTTESI